MGLLSRLSYVIRSKMNSLLNRAEDPAEQLDYSYEKMRDELQEVKQGIADLTTQKKRLEIKRDNLEENVEKHNKQAREAVDQGRDDLARKALQKKEQKMNQIEELNSEINDLDETQDNLVEKKNKLQSRIEDFRTKKETMKAKQQAAEASVQVSESLSGVGDEMGDVARTIERAEEETEEMEARADAMDELEGETFDDALSDQSELERELEDVTTSGEVESELSQLKEDAGVDTSSTDSTDDSMNSENTDSSESVESELEDLENEVSTDKELEVETESSK